MFIKHQQNIRFAMHGRLEKSALYVTNHWKKGRGVKHKYFKTPSSLCITDLMDFLRKRAAWKKSRIWRMGEIVAITLRINLSTKSLEPVDSLHFAGTTFRVAGASRRCRPRRDPSTTWGNSLKNFFEDSFCQFNLNTAEWNL